MIRCNNSYIFDDQKVNKLKGVHRSLVPPRAHLLLEKRQVSVWKLHSIIPVEAGPLDLDVDSLQYLPVQVSGFFLYDLYVFYEGWLRSVLHLIMQHTAFKI